MTAKLKSDPIVLGHNSFFGVDHLSSARGSQRESHFSKPQRILDLIDLAESRGIHALMLSTHVRAAEILSMLRFQRKNTQLRLYPLLPYVQKYVTAANQKGLLNVIFDMLSDARGADKLRMIWSGAKAVVGKDFRSVLAGLIQVELQPFQGFEVPYVFLHDAFTDLALAFDLKEIFEFYIEEIAKNYGAEAAFTTKNLPAFLEKFKQYGLGAPLVMTHVNACGFSMNPSKEAVESSLHANPARVLAMSTLASGYLKPEEAYSYVGSLPGIESIVVGVSSEGHLDETITAIRKYQFHSLEAQRG